MSELAGARLWDSGSVLVTGGAGFIGSNFVLDWFAHADRASLVRPLVVLDKLTYAGTLANLVSVAQRPDYTFVHGDICDESLVATLVEQHRPSAILHFAAESHVDRSIADPKAFLHTNIGGTFAMLRPLALSMQRSKGQSAKGFAFSTSQPTKSTVR